MTQLYPVRRRRLKIRLSGRRGKVFHPLSQQPFSDEIRARADWIERAKAYYSEDLAYVLKEQMQWREPGLQIIGNQVDAKAQLAVLSAQEWATPEIGKVTVRYLGKGIRVPEPCHPGDDWQNRAAAVLAGATSFYFDEEAKAVLPRFEA